MMRTIYFTLLLALPFCGWGQDIVHIAGNYTYGYSGDGGRAYYAALSYPWSICRDTAGNLYIGDHGDPIFGWGYVRKIEAATGIITTIAGGIDSVTATDTLNNIPATDAFIYYAAGLCIDRNGNLLIADGLSRVQKVNLVTGMITTIAGHYKAYEAATADSGDGGSATNAIVGAPYDVAVDTANNIYIACQYAIRRIDAATGIINRVAGIDTGGYGGDGGPATAATFNGIFGIYVDKENNIYIADTYNNEVRMIRAATGIITCVAGCSGIGYFGGDGGPATAAGLFGPINVTKDDIGNMYISDFDNLRIRRVDTTGTITTYAGGDTTLPPNTDTIDDNGPATAAYINAKGICMDTCGNLFATDRDGCSIRAITAPGTGLPEGGWLCGYNILEVASTSLPQGEVMLWPNPAVGGAFSVRVSSGVNEDVQIVITDMMGEKVEELSTVTNKDTEVRLHTAVGVYFITAITGSERYSVKVVCGL